MKNIRTTIYRLSTAARVWLLLVLVVFVSSAGLFSQADKHEVQAATSSTINFQARLLTSGGALVPDGYYNVKFNLYTASSGGSTQWTEEYYDSNGVTAGNDNRVRVVNGYLSVYLGSLTSFPSTINWDQEQWLTINIGGTAQTATPTYDGEMSPRLKLSASPYALTAGSLQKTSGANELKLNLATPTADVTYTLQNAAAGNYDICTTATVCTGYAASSGSGSYIQNGTTPQTADFNITGTGTIGGNFTVTGQQVSIQPASNLGAGQSNISQTLTNGSSSGGTVNGYSQSITISNTSSGSTTNGFNISLTDSSSGALSNINRGINISLSGSNSSRAEIGLLSTVTRGVALQGISSGFFGNGNVSCNGVNVGLGLCAGDTATSNGGAGIYGYTSSRGTSSITAVEGTGVYGISSSGGGGVAGAFYTGLKGITGNTANAAYTSMGVFGQARGGNGASIYGGYFTLNPSSSATAVGSALFASNSSTTTNILQLQDNTTDVFTVADGGNITATGTYNGQTISSTANFTGTITVAGLLTANGNLTLQTGDTFTMNGDAFTDLTGAGLTISSGALTVDNSALDDNFFIQGGNSFGNTATIGTNDSNNLAFETGGTTRWFIDTSGHLLPNANDTYDIGSDTARVRDLYAGPGTVHIGTSTSDEGTISYNTTTNNLTFAATNGVLFQNANNSTTAFQIQASGVSGNQLFIADTSNNRVNVIGDVNVGTRFGNRLFSDNFEGGSLGLWDQGVSGSIATSTTTVHAGKYSTQVNPAAGYGYASATVSANSTVYARAWVYVASQTSATADLLTLQNTGGDSFSVSRDSGNLKFWDGVTGVTTDSGTALPTGGWHLIEMRVTIGSGTGATQVWLDGTQVINLSSQDNGALSIGTVKIGDSTGGRTFTTYIDDVVADTASTGTASSLNVDDSFHVGGTSTFGGNVLVQNTLSVSSLQPVTAGSMGTTDLTTVDSTGTVGQYSTVVMGLDGYPRISYYDTTNTDLKFAQCTNAACTTSNLTAVDSTGTVGQFNYLAIGSDGFARISYYDTTNTDLKFAQCTNAACTTSNLTAVDSTGTVGQYSSIAMGTDGFARISYYDGTNGDLKYAQCTNAACSTSVITTVDSTGTVGQYSAITVGSDGFARIAYRDNTNGLKMVRCTNAACTTSNITVIDSSTTGATWTSIAMGLDGWARMAYYDSTNTNVKFVQCTNANCSSNNISIVDSADSVGQYTGLAIGSDGFARISYYNATDGDLMLAQCLNASCSNNNITTVDSTGTVGQYSSVAAGSDGYFNIAYYDTTNTDLKFARVGNAFTGSTIGSSSSPFGAIYGTTLNVQGAATFQQSVEIDNNLTVNGAIYVNGNIDATTYSANGVAGLTLTCSSGSSLENAIISGGIITGGDCINSSYARIYKSTSTAVGSGSIVSPAYNSERVDTDNYHTGSNTYFTIPSDGFYNLGANIEWTGGTSGTVQICFRLVSSTIIGCSSTPYNTGWLSAATSYYFTSGQTVEMYIYSSSSAITVTASGNYSHEFYINKIQSGGSGVSNTLQQSYDMGNTITTTSGRDIQFTLADTTTDSNFLVNVASGSTSKFAVQNAGTDMFSVNPSTANISLGANNPGSLQPWQTSSNPLPVTTQNAVTVTANGFVYVIGGATTASDGSNCEGTGGTIRSTAYYAKLNADGSNTSWNTTTALPVGLCDAMAVVANGYVYIAGGDNGTSDVNTVYFARLNADGTLGTWRQNAQNLPTTRDGGTMVASNGYLYVLDGSQSWNGSGDNTLYYAQINTDGSTTSWTSVTGPRGTLWATAVTANGYLYLIGGYSSYTTVAYAPLNPSNGSIGTWNNTTSLPAAANAATSVVANGYVYVMGGTTPTYSSAATNAVYYAKLNSNGTVGSWSSTSSLPTAQEFAGSVVVNGYVYVIGGQSNWSSGTVRSTVYYASTQRIQVGGSLDLVGLAGGNLVDDNPYGAGSVGGSLTAGDTTIVGTIRVQGQATFNSSLTTNGVLTANGGARLSSIDVRRDVQASGENAIRLSTTNGQDWKIYQATGTSNLTFWSDSTNQDILTLDVNTGGALFKNAAVGGDSNAFRVQSQGGTNFYRADTLVGSNNFGANSNVFTPASDGNVLQVISNTGSLATFNVNTSSKIVQIGSTANDTNGFLLQLDNYGNGATEPSGTNGAMYYNTVTNTFRCFENSAWADCLSHHIIVMGSDVADSSGACTMTNATGLSFSVTSGKNYRFLANIIYTSAATTTGVGFGATGPTHNQLAVQSTNGGNAAAQGAGNTANGTFSCSANSGSTGTDGNAALVSGFISPTANGTLQLQFASEVNGSAITLKAGSTLEWW